MSTDEPGRIILHVGAPKTGSTYLQRRLRIEPEALRRQGVHVPVMQVVEAMAGNAKLLATVLSQEPSLSFQRVFPELDCRKLDPAAIVSELLRDWSPSTETIVLSAENFRPDHAGRLAALLPKGHDVRVILFVRRQDLWVESYYNQLLKTGDIRGSLSEFVDAVLSRRSDRFCYPDWEEHFEVWHSTFRACQLVFFDEVRADLFGAFCGAARLAPMPQIREIEPQQVSLNLHQLCYLAELPREIPHGEFVRRRRANEIAASDLDAPRAPRGRLLDAKLYAKLVAHFSPSNDRLLRRLYGADGASRLAFPDELAGSMSIEDIAHMPTYQDHRRRADAHYERLTR